MPPPIGPYDRANPPSAQLTQSRDDVRQQTNADQGYNPDALHRALDWIGRQFGSGQRAGPSGGSRVLDWIGRQFDSNPRVTNPYDRRNPAVDAWFRALENSPTPFGDVQYGPPAPKPVTKISSAPNLAKIVQSALGGPSQPYIPLTPLPGYGGTGPGGGAMPGEDRAQAPQWPPPPMEEGPWGPMLGEDRSTAPQWPPPGAPEPVDFRSGPVPDYNMGPLPATDPSYLDRILARSRVLPRQPPPPAPRTAGPSPFSTTRAHGGPIGLMRGGYPELYGSERMPVRHTFDSGGENFVGDSYGNSSGRADDVNAKLSPKEYVMDAESMALLGDGNPDHGAQKMDQMRANLRKEKGKALAKGKFSPKAKSAQEYLAGNPMGDGLRRRGRDKG